MVYFYNFCNWCTFTIFVTFISNFCNFFTVKSDFVIILRLNDEIKNKEIEFFAVGGLMEFVKWINKSKDVLHKPIYFKREMNNIVTEVSIQYNSGYQENIFGFVNLLLFS